MRRNAPDQPADQPLVHDTPETIYRIRDVFDQAGYSDTEVAEATGMPDYLSLRDIDIPRLRRRLGHDTPLETLIRLFILGVPVDLAALQRAVQPMRWEDWAEAGLLVPLDRQQAVAPVALYPYKGLIVAFDWARLQPNHVMGIASSTVTLATLLLSYRSRLTLDLGTGCGILAFLVARHSERVLAVDRNPRAINIARFNAHLNRLASVECRSGDLFAPVEGETFDLIVSNPPYVVSPESRYLFRDSGMAGDAFCRMLTREASSRLRQGGYYQCLCNWIHLAGQDWQERLAGWFVDSGCDVWVMRSETMDAATYASAWIRATEGEEPEQFQRHFTTWMDYYERQRIEAISLGVIIMRRASGRTNWFRADDAPENMRGPCGDAMLRGFALRDFLETVHDDRKLLEARLRLAAEVRWEQQYVPTAEGWHMAAGHVHLSEGLAYTGTVDPVIIRLMIRCDGQRTVRDVLADVAASLGTGMESIAPACLDVTRHLILQGFLLPTGREQITAPRPT